jgi:hypothetical protein
MTSAADHELDPIDFDEELLTAYLDDEVTSGERAIVEAALTGSADLRTVLDGLTTARRAVRDLPWLQPPPELAPLLARRVDPPRRSRYRQLAAVGAVLTLAAWGLFLTRDTVPGIEVPVAEAVETHAKPAGDLRTPSPSDDWAPREIGYGYELEAVGEMRGMRVARYSGENSRLTLFERSGHVRWDRLPADGYMSTVDGASQWRGQLDGYHIAVRERGGRVFIAVLDPGTDEMPADLELESDGGTSLIDRLARSCHRTLELFGLS